MANPLELVKKHPVAATAGGLVLFAVVLFALNSGGGETYSAGAGGGTTDASGEMAGSIAMANIQAQLSAKSLEVNAAKEVALNDSSTRLTLAQLDRAAAADNAAKAYALEEKRIAASSADTALVSTLQATLAEKSLAYQKDMFTSQQANIKAQQDTVVKLAEINARPKGLLSMIFG